ncbi:CBS domain-containing protein [Pyxidicoccus xibeiensis]|uniref:CBS domain-containing protein n=1 Tax=Pyxidicoccus xibeiensis TaxID=2906759 RepID=UPI0020A71E4D|nr:CBS domain-containing protein [Pyxidicoccus xibeiensis]MCP3140014.1 CBS domain-containing protein [Pyxidicoccus xibeiensis]
MTSCRSPQLQSLIVRAVTLFPEDTVLSALQVMHHHGVHVLPVVDGRGGELLGEVTEGELQRLSASAPLARLAEILTVKALSVPEETTVLPYEPALSDASPRWLH